MSSKCAPNFSAISKETKKTAENLDVLNNQLLEIGTKFQITSQALTNGGDSLFTSMQAFVEELATSIPSALSDTASNIGFIVVDTWKKLVTAFLESCLFYFQAHCNNPMRISKPSGQGLPTNPFLKPANPFKPTGAILSVSYQVILA